MESIIVAGEAKEVFPEDKNVYEYLIAEYQLMASDDGIEWKPEYEKFIYQTTLSICDEVHRYRQEVISDTLALTDNPWDEQED